MCDSYLFWCSVVSNPCAATVTWDLSNHQAPEFRKKSKNDFDVLLENTLHFQKYRKFLQ